MTSRDASSEFASSSSAAGPAPPRRPGRALALAQQVAAPLFALAVLFGLWEAAVVLFDIKPFLLPAPSRIFADCAENLGTLAGHTIVTLRTVLIGFLVSVAVSLPLAVAITSSAWLANVIYPVLVLTQSIPKVALAPILVILLGANELPRIVVTFLVAFFPLVIAIATGLMSVPAELVELGRSYRGSGFQILRRIKLPYATPMIFSGLKVAVTLSVVGAVVGEFVNADAGLGYFIVTSTAFFQTPLAFGALIVLSVMGIALFQSVGWIERRFFPWSAGAGAGAVVS